MLYHVSLQMICLKVWARVSQLSQTSSLPKSFVVFSLMTSFTCWVRHNGLLFTSSLMSLDNPCQLSLCSAATECFLQDGLCTLQFVLFDQCAGLNTWNEMWCMCGSGAENSSCSAQDRSVCKFCGLCPKNLATWRCPRFLPRLFAQRHWHSSVRRHWPCHIWGMLQPYCLWIISCCVNSVTHCFGFVWSSHWHKLVELCLSTASHWHRLNH